MIPKVIHYCWFGNKSKPQLIENCRASWEEHLSNFKLVEWNEKNTDLKHPFVQKAYEDKKYAFVADYVRLKVLYEQGGVYLDTDMLIIKSFDELLNNQAFIGIESKHYISCGIIGVPSKHPYIKACLDYYNKIDVNNLNYKEIVIPKIFTKIYKEMYGVNNGITSKLHFDLNVYPEEYFYPYPNPPIPTSENAYKKYIQPSTYAVHLWHKSWKKTNALTYMRRGDLFKSLSTFIIELTNRSMVVDKKYCRKLASAFKQNFF